MSTTASVACQFYNNLQHTGVTSYEVSPINLKDIEAINLHTRANLLRAARLSLKDCVDRDEASEVLDSVARTAAQLSYLGLRNSEYFSSVDGYSLVLWHSIVKKFPEFTLEQAASIVLDDRNQSEMAFAMQVINGSIDKRPEVKPDTINPTTTESPAQ